MVFDRTKNLLEHRQFSEISRYISPGDLLVQNASKVVPARLSTVPKNGRNSYEIFFLRKVSENSFEALVKPGRRFKIGAIHEIGDGIFVGVKTILDGGTRVLSLRNPVDILTILKTHGKTPLPPYITSCDCPPERYQTIFAREEGSLAAPTAGLHFDSQLLADLEKKGVVREELLLHIGMGTFKPIESENIENHPMHSERFFISQSLAEKFLEAKERGKKIFACGTTTVRSLETALLSNGILKTGWQFTNSYITPGYKFRAIDHLITNFHLPRSTLLVLVSALCGLEKTLNLYSEAISQKYRFYSFGDAMLIL